MSLNFSNRILTSIILLLIVSLGLFINKFFWLYLIFITSMISYYEFNNLIKTIFKNKKNKIYISNFIAFLYLSLFMYAGYHLYISTVKLLIFIILICIFSDTGGYVVGKTIGGKKLTKISPKKTISGSIGSLVFSLIPIIIFSLILDNDYLFIDLPSIVFICLFLSLVCQFGDLFISYFKRLAKVKDTGKILPGHGGLLDRIDGILLVIPVAYFLDKLFL